MKTHNSSRVISLSLNPDKSEKLRSYMLVSFQIPVLNGKRTLAKCLESITRQDYPRKEVLVIDNGSTDDSPELARILGAKVFFRPGPLGGVRQFGIDVSEGEFIALWDSDLYIPHDRWLTDNIRRFAMYPKATTLWVRTVAPPGANALTRAYDWYSWAVILRLVNRGIGFWGGGASIFRTDSLRQIPRIPSDIDQAEDFFIARNLAETGRPVLFSDDPLYHDSHNSLRELVRKDVRRAFSFKDVDLKISTGVPFSCLVSENITVGFLISFENLLKKKQVFFAFVPVMVLLRLIIYGLLYLI